MTLRNVNAKRQNIWEGATRTSCNRFLSMRIIESLYSFSEFCRVRQLLACKINKLSTYRTGKHREGRRTSCPFWLLLLLTTGLPFSDIVQQLSIYLCQAAANITSSSSGSGYHITRLSLTDKHSLSNTMIVSQGVYRLTDDR